jgi:hypothetical protein
LAYSPGVDIRLGADLAEVENRLSANLDEVDLRHITEINDIDARLGALEDGLALRGLP